MSQKLTATVSRLPQVNLEFFNAKHFRLHLCKALKHRNRNSLRTRRRLPQPDKWKTSLLSDEPKHVNNGKNWVITSLLKLISTVSVQHPPLPCWSDHKTLFCGNATTFLHNVPRNWTKSLASSLVRGVAGCMSTWPLETEYGQEVSLIRGTKVTPNSGWHSKIKIFLL